MNYPYKYLLFQSSYNAGDTFNFGYDAYLVLSDEDGINLCIRLPLLSLLLRMILITIELLIEIGLIERYYPKWR